MFMQSKSVLLLCALLVLSFFAGPLKAEVVLAKSDRSPLAVTPHVGDTLWAMAHKYYGHARYYPLIMAENKIVDARHLVAGKAILIPALPANIPGKALRPVHSLLLYHPLPHAFNHKEIVETMESNGPLNENYEFFGPVPTPVAPEPAVPAMVQPVQQVRAQKITGYQIRILGESAQGIPLHRSLLTCVILFDSRRQNCRYRAWAEESGDTRLLTISLKDLPKEHFALVVDGMHNRITDKSFIENATPVYGRFPGPRGFTLALRSVGQSAVRGAIAGALTGNPFIGVGVAVAPYAFHGVEAIVKSLRQ